MSTNQSEASDQGGSKRENHHQNDSGKKTEKAKKVPVIFAVENTLNKLAEFRKNEITNSTEFRFRDEKEFKPVDEHSLYRALQYRSLYFKLPEVNSLLRSDFVPRYHPFHEYFNGLPTWDGYTDHISKLGSYIQAENQSFFNVMLKKMMVRCIVCALDNIPNRTVFVLVGPQEIGKSWFIRYLNPFGKEYFSEAPLKDNKDSAFRLAENFIINMEEIDDLTNVQLSKLKATISMSTIKERKPYDRDEIVMPRRCSFFGSTNKPEFLTDSENTRWLCMQINGINHNYRTEFNIDLAWAQAFALYKQGYFYDLSEKEKKQRNDINKDYEVSTAERDALMMYTEPGDPDKGTTDFMTVHQILDYLHKETTIQLGDWENPRENLNPIRLNKYELLKSLSALGYKRGRKWIKNKQVRGYYISIPQDLKEQQIKNSPPEQPLFDPETFGKHLDKNKKTPQKVNRNDFNLSDDLIPNI